VLFAKLFGILAPMTQLEPSRSGGVIPRYSKFLPLHSATPVVSLGEGSTPLVFASRLSDQVGCRVIVKCEGLNPTASFKDRGMTVAVSKALGAGAKVLLCASTGNTAASAAAYAAHAGIACAVILPAGKIAAGKLTQAVAHGATIVSIDGNFDDALRIVRELAEEKKFSVVNSINPDRIAGQKTAAFEIIDELGDAPAVHVLPLGNAGNLTAYWKGYVEFHKLGRSKQTPRMIGIQAKGAAPIYHKRIIEKPETVASAIRIGNPASWEAAQNAVDESEGAVEIVFDDEILAAQLWLARNEGIFVEPASAAPIAWLLQKSAKRERLFSDNPIIACTVTGHGLKDPHVVKSEVPEPVAATVKAVREVLKYS
jgi:threonine synthase